MNIWCISKYASPPNYGAGARLFFLTKEFIKLGHNAILITSDSNHLATFPETDKKYNREEISNVPVYWVKTKKYNKTASISRILSWLDFEIKLFSFPKNNLPKPDVVLVSSLSLFSIVYAYYLKKKFRAFLVFEIRDIWPLTMTEEGGFSRWHPLVLLLGMIEKFGYKHSDLIVGTMPKLDLHIKNVLGYERRFFCSPLGFEPDKYKPDIDQGKNPFDEMFPSNKIVIGYAGSMGLTNALEPFIGAIELLKDVSEIHFMLVGGGDLRADFEAKLIGCNNVSFLPRMPQKQVKYFLDKCDILYLSTKDSKVWEYGQSMNKVVEYMLAAKPIIASYTGYQSMLDEADCGVFIKTTVPIDVKNAIVNMVNLESPERIKMGEKGRAWIFSHRQYSVLAKQYIDEINKLMII